MSAVSHAAIPAPSRDRPLRLTQMSDELLARHAARGSERAFTVIYERYAQSIYRYCRSIVRSEPDAQDALQSTFTSALTALRRNARNAPLRPWLYRIAHNESVSILRRRKRDVAGAELAEPVAFGSSAEEVAAGRARWQQLVRDVGELPERQRASLLLRELAGLSHEEIAVALGLTVGGAKQAIFEARQGLSEVEEGRAMSCEDVRRRISEGDRRVLRGRRVRAHLRGCPACENFALAIPARRSELNALAPVLPPLATATVLGRVLSAAAPQGGASAAGSAVAAGSVGKLAGSAVAWKAVTGVAIVATAAAGVNGLTHVFQHTPPAPFHSSPRTAHPAVPAGPTARHQGAGGGTAAAYGISSAHGARGTAADHGAASSSTWARPSAAVRHRSQRGNEAVAHRSAAAHGGQGRALGHSSSAAHRPAAAHGRSAAQTHRQAASSTSAPSGASQHRGSSTRRHMDLNLNVQPQVSPTVTGVSNLASDVGGQAGGAGSLAGGQALGTHTAGQ